MTAVSIFVDAANSNASSDVPFGRNKRPLVSVVLLSYNRPALFEEALASVLHQSYDNLEVIVVDNPSLASAEVTRLVSQFPKVQLIQTDFNQGYAGGMNRGIERACGDYVYLTEDDIVLESDCIQRLVEYMDETLSADLVAPIIYNKATKTIRCAGGSFTLGGIYRKEVYGADEQDVGQFPQPFDVNYIDGATMFASMKFWRQFRGFREEYFMYVDAVELCVRVMKAGNRMAVVPQARVYHFEPTPEPLAPELEFHKLKNFFSLYVLHAPARILPEFICRYAIGHGMRTLFANSGSQPRVFFKALLWFARRSPSLLRERYGRKGYAN